MVHHNSTLEKFFDIEKEDSSSHFIRKEIYSRYQKIWNNLLSGGLERSFNLEFKKKFTFEDYLLEFYNNNFLYTEENALKLLRSVGWRQQPYDKQHWGVWLHSLSPYQGRITPSFAHWLIKIFSSKNEVVLDPFCGVGTVCLEAVILKRNSIGNDLSPYAHLITKGKFETGSLKENLDYLKKIKNIDTSKISLKNIPEWIKAYFEEETLKEIIFLRDKLQKEKKHFLLGCLMGILHGNRPGYLSVYTGCIIPMKPRSKEHPKFRLDKDVPEYRAVIPRMAAKVMRMFETPFPDIKGRSLQEDTRNLSLNDDSVDVIITSPPYYNTLDYVGVNKVRLFFLGLDGERQGNLKEELIQDKRTYIEEMIKAGEELKRVLKPNHYLVYILGDVHYTKSSINTAKEVSKVYQEHLGFKEIDIVNDEIPRNKTASQTRRKKFDRVLVMKNIK